MIEILPKLSERTLEGSLRYHLSVPDDKKDHDMILALIAEKQRRYELE